ncbi:MAG: type II toxin-antitoxin system RelE/ParE family toxin [Selenomonas artemidis]
MKWAVDFLPEAADDLARLDGSQRQIAVKAIEKVRQNPLPNTEGGYGKPLGNVAGTVLAGLLKIKLRGQGLRIVYRLLRTEKRMVIIVIGIRADDLVYQTAQGRISK